MKDIQSDKIKTISEKIKNEISRYNKAIELYNQEKLIEYRNGAPYNPITDEKIEEEKDDITKNVTQLIKDLRILSLKENYYFFDCSYSVYKNKYTLRKFLYEIENIYAVETDYQKRTSKFIKS